MLKNPWVSAWAYNTRSSTNNMKHTTTYLLIFITLFSACKKRDLPVDISGEPVFYAQCEIEGKPIRVEAGSNDYSMNATYYMDSNNVYVYRADLKQKNCGNACGYGLSVLFNDVSVTNAARNADSALKTGVYVFANNDITPVLHRWSFAPSLPQYQGGSYQWNVRDGANLNKTFSGYLLKTDLDVNKTYSVSLNYSDNSGCSMTHNNIFSVGNPLQTNITPVKEISSSAIIYTFSSVNTGKPPYSYKWEFNDQSADDISFDKIIKHTFMPKASGSYLTKLTLTDADLNTCVSYYSVPATTVQGACIANFESGFVPVLNNLSLSKITVLLNAPDGKVYSSRDAVQAQNSKFEVVSVEDFITNQDGEPTKKIRIKFNCVVNDGTSLINITNGEAIIAVAHKK